MENKPQNDTQWYTRNKAFMALFMMNEDSVYRYILALTGNYTEADDLMQETAVTMLSRFDQFKPDSNFAAWALTIARFKVMSHRKQKKHDPACFSEETFNNLVLTLGRSVESSDELVGVLQKCLSKLKESDRKIVSMRYEHHTTTKETAQKTGRSIDGLYQTLARIHDLLHKCIRNTLTSWDCGTTR